MKVIRRKHGFSVHGTDSELEALSAMVMAGLHIATDKKQHDHLSRGAKTAIRRTQFQCAPLAVTDNRRDK